MTTEGTALPTIGIVGRGLVGSRVALNLSSSGVSIRTVSRTQVADLAGCDAVVLAHGGSHAALVASLITQGIAVVSAGDDLTDVMASLDLGDKAADRGVPVVVGAAASPGMTGLLLAHVTRAFDVVDEVHVAVHGTGGPVCAHRHHDALAGTSIGWHDGEWLQRPAGSGRELCWFPDPVGARDCYRFASPDPLLLQRVSPQLKRITTRVSATRRDRLTARLPMLAPPHREGGVGGLRVEVRGTRQGARQVEVVGVAEKVALVAGAVAAQTALSLVRGGVAPGVHSLGQAGLPNADILDGVLAAGVTLHQFVGV
ncbi:MAG: hypothetical protein ACKOQ7_04565 [Actinomycetota bacterium]